MVVSATGDTAIPGAHWQQEGLAASFAERRRILIPLLDVQEDVVRRLLAGRARDAHEGAPACSECGMLMVPNGACYKCENCGSTSGCS